MRTLTFPRNLVFAFELVAILAGIFADSSWSQERRRDRGGRRDDPASLLSAYQDAKTVPLLKLSKEQDQQLGALRDSLRRINRQGNRDDQQQAKKDLEDKALDLLNDEQKTAWQKRKEEILAEQTKAEPDAAGGSPTEVAPTETRGTVPVEAIPEGAITVISFGPAATAKAAAGEAEANPKTTVKDHGAAKEEKKLTFNFRYAPWVDVLKLFAEINDLSLDLNDIPPGTFNYVDNDEHTMTEALDIINGYLLGHGYALVRRDRFLVCLNIIENKIPPNVIPNVTKEELEKRGKNELLSLVLPLDGLDAEKIANEVKELLGPQGTASSLKNSNSLVLTDIGSNLRRVSELLGSTNPIYSRDTAFKAIPLKHISADVAERKVRLLFNLGTAGSSSSQSTAAAGGRGGMPNGGGRGNNGGGGGNWGGGRGGGGNGFGGFGGDQGGGPGGGGQPGAPMPPTVPNPTNTAAPFTGKIQVIGDTQTKHLLVIAKGEYLKVVEEVVLALDRDIDAMGNRVDSKDNPTYLKTYSVPGSDSTAISNMLNNLIPGVVIGDEPRSGKIYVNATKEEHDRVAKIIKENSGVSSDVAVISLLKLDPLKVMQTLKNLYVGEVPRAPSIEADPANRRIIVRGNADQLSQVKTMLRDMGETSVRLNDDSPEAPQSSEDRGTSRRVNLGNHDPEEIEKILGVVQRTWDASGHTPIRVVIPSRSNPIRDRRIPGSNQPSSEPTATDTAPIVRPRRELPQTENKKSTDRVPTIRSNDPNRESGKPQNQKRVPRTRPATTQIIPRPVPAIQTKLPVIQTNQTTVKDFDENEEQSVPVKSDLNEDATTDASGREALLEKSIPQTARQELAAVDEQSPPADKESPIGITVMGNNLLLTSPDTKALDQLEEIIGAIMAALPQRNQWTVFYLRTADAAECATLIEKLFPQGSSSTTPASNDGFFGGFWGFNRGSTTTQPTSTTQSLADGQNLRIITDARANALFVTGPKDLIRDIEYVLALVDSGDAPGTMRERFPRTIPVEYADVEDVADVISDLFKDSMTPEQPQQAQAQGQGQQGFSPFSAMMFAGNRGGGGGGGGNNAARKPVELTLGIDKRTNHLIVSCNETMFQRVETVVKEIDQRAKDAHRTVRVVELKTADPMVVQTTLTSLMPRVTVGATRPKRAKKTNETTTPGQQQPPDAQMIQRMTDQNNNQQGMGGRNAGGGGGGRGNNGGRRGTN